MGYVQRRKCYTGNTKYIDTYCTSRFSFVPENSELLIVYGVLLHSGGIYGGRWGRGAGGDDIPSENKKSVPNQCQVGPKIRVEFSVALHPMNVREIKQDMKQNKAISLGGGGWSRSLR